MEVLVSVIGQKLRISTNAKTFVEGTQNFIKFIFSLSNEWIGLDVKAQFIQNGVAYDCQLDSECSVFLPSDIHDGKCELILYGSSGLIVAVTDGVILNIKRSNYTNEGKENVIVFATLEEMREYLQI